MKFKLTSEFEPTGDQPEAIRQLVAGFHQGLPAQTLLGVTGSGKTFTMANVIHQLQQPTLILSHNKTLAAQLYGEFKQFFPENAVEYFVSYYDYYQPEAYLPTSNTYIEKDLSINEEIEKLRLSATSSLMSGRRDIIVVSSVSCIYGMGNPEAFNENVIHINVGQKISRNRFLHDLVSSLYSRSSAEFKRGNFRVKGDTVDIYLAYADFALRVVFWGDEIEEIHTFDPQSGMEIENQETYHIYPANLFVTTKDSLQASIIDIQEDMVKQVAFFEKQGRDLEAKRLLERTEHDLEMMRELGYCSGIENYSRYFDRRMAGQRPFCLLDYFADDFLMMIDESHVTVSQIRAMYGGDRARKINLVEHGFRLPAAMDNRPLQFDEYRSLLNQVLYVSATPADYELQESEGVVVEQLIRPTGLLDPVIEVRPVENQIDDLLEEIADRVSKTERVLVTTLTKRMAEELHKYLQRLQVSCSYIHSDIDTLERVEILRELRLGTIDVLIGVNLLREGLDLPEVSLVAILDADKEGFLRSHRSLTQTAGRAARNLSGKVIMYAERITDSMRKTIDETERRRTKQMAYNKKNGWVPRSLKKSKAAILEQTSVVSAGKSKRYYEEPETEINIAADPVVQYMSKEALQKNINDLQKKMEKASRELDFIQAALFRDEMLALKKLMSTK